MSIQALALAGYAIGWLLTYQWMKRLLVEDEKYAEKPNEAFASALLTGAIWPVAVPSHLIYLARKKLSGSSNHSK